MVDTTLVPTRSEFALVALLTAAFALPHCWLERDRQFGRRGVVPPSARDGLVGLHDPPKPTGANYPPISSDIRLWHSSALAADLDIHIPRVSKRLKHHCSSGMHEPVVQDQTHQTLYAVVHARKIQNPHSNKQPAVRHLSRAL